MTVSTDAVRAKLEAARTELLDLGLRNPLLNYRPPRARGVVVVDELPEQVFRMLVTEGRKLSFLPASEDAVDGLLGQPPELQDVATPGKALPRHADTRLQTGLTSAKLQAALLTTQQVARTFIEEQGANTLFMAFGMLEWREPGSQGDVRRAPLILVPVELSRASAQSRFQLSYGGEDLGDNLSLALRLEADFALTLPPLPPAEDLDVKGYLAEVAALVKEQSGWRVDREAVVLGFFAFGKFLMYRDLDAQGWPAAHQPSRHAVLRALLDTGFNEPVAPFEEDSPLDDGLAPGDPPTVVDADGSQILAIVGARAGRNLVIQGPPGTGKSQTITNLIADALAHGRTVLFVAEKQAALDVVKRRLDAVGLGDACLELHSHKASKRAVMAELRRTLELGRPRTSPELAHDLGIYAEMREHLNATCNALSEPVGSSGLTPYQALGALVTGGGSAVVLSPPIPDLALWSAADWRRRKALLERLEGVAAALGTPAEHPFYASNLREWGPSAAGVVRAAVARARAATERLQQLAEQLAPGLPAAPVPTDPVAAARLFASLARLADPPPLPGLTLDAPEWLLRHDDLRRLATSGGRLAELRRGLEPLVVPDAWDEHLLDTRLQLAAHGRKPLRWLNADYRRAFALLKSLCRNHKVPTTLDACLALLDALSEAARHRSLVRDLQGLGETAFWPHWIGLDSDWASFERATAWLHELNVDLSAGRLAPELPAAFKANPGGVPAPAELPQALAALQEHTVAWRALEQALVMQDTLTGWTFEAQLATLGNWEARAESLSEWVGYGRLAAQVAEDGMGALLALADAGPPPGTLVAALARARYEAVLEHAMRERPPLAGFSGPSQEIEIATFRDLDVAITVYNRASLALKHWDELPTLKAGGGGAGQMPVLQRELEKKTRHMPLRQLLVKADAAIQRVKPIFMMSPRSIATYLAPDGPRFDLVVFDEASQVRPVDALGAIARGTQLVVVGDKRQMPPTDFFDTQLSNETPGDADDGGTRDFESILGLMEAQGAPQHMLRWHYRSRHESLIAVSNEAFYDGRLVVFPSPDAARETSGLKLTYVAEAVYDRGGTRTNMLEAAAVARAVMAHALARPGESLGVAAFSVAQQQAILAALEQARREDPSAEPFFNAHPHEPFFVKNLETVQGDERDVMMLGTAYGRDAQGKLTLNFGPLNREGGERRLNVLITRARIRCEVFTSLRAEDLPDAPGTPAGVAALRQFLAYAAANSPSSGAQATPEGPSEDGLLDAITAELQKHGYTVDRAVGSGTFRLDLGVRDPAHAGRYLLAVMTDGPAYAGARAARDRDRLRAQVLEGLGWRLHRVWSLDWHFRPQTEARRLLAALEAAREAPVEALPSPAAPPALERDEVASTPEVSQTSSYVFAAPAVDVPLGGLSTLATNHMAQLVADVVALESPVHPSEVSRRIATSAGVKRPTMKVLAALEAAVAHALRVGLVRQQGDFLWTLAMEVPPIRDRAQIPAAQRRLELIAPEERARAIERAASDAYGLQRADVVLGAARLLGYTRPNEDVRNGLDADVGAALILGRIRYQGDYLVPAD